MVLVFLQVATVLLASLTVLVGTWLLVVAGRVLWPVLLLVVGVAFQAAAYRLEVRAPLLLSSLVLAVAIGAGTTFGWWLRDRALLSIALVAAAASDLVAVLTPAGFTRQIVADAARGGRLLSYMAVSFPWAGRAWPVVGFADLMLLAAIIVALRTMGVRWWLAFAVPFTGSLLALAAAFAVGSMPGLPFLAATTLIFLYLRPAKPKRETLVHD